MIPAMSDTTDDTTSRDTPHATSRDVTRRDSVSVHDAARVLGITEDAVRARLRRGSLSGEKIATTWYVFLPDLAAGVAEDGTTRHDVARQSVHHVTRHDTMPTVVDLAPLADVIRYQEEIIERQSRELSQLNAAAAMWQERARSLEGQLIALNPGETTPSTLSEATGSPRSDDSGLRGLWARVRRLWGR